MTSPNFAGHVPKKQLRSAVILFTSLFVAGAMLLAFSLGGCAASNLPKAAQANRSVATIIADDCTIAVQAKALYETGKIPNTDAARYTINAAGAACEQSKTAFLLLLKAEQAYRDAEAAQVNACTPTPGTPENVDLLPGCKTSAAAAADAKVKVDSASSDLSTAVSTMTSKASAAQSLVPKQ